MISPTAKARYASIATTRQPSPLTLHPAILYPPLFNLHSSPSPYTRHLTPATLHPPPCLLAYIRTYLLHTYLYSRTCTHLLTYRLACRYATRRSTPTQPSAQATRCSNSVELCQTQPNLLAYLLAYLLTYLHTYLRTCVLSHLRTHLRITPLLP